MNKFIILTALIYMLTACSASKPTAQASAKEIFEELKKEAGISDLVTHDLTKTEYAANFGILSDDVEEGYVCISGDNMEADELFVIRGKDDDAVEKIERALGNEIIALTNGFESEDDESSEVKNHVFKTKDKYVLLYMGKNPDKIEEKFNSMFG